MKVVIAQLQHETNTFSPVPTPWESFGGHGGPALVACTYLEGSYSEVYPAVSQDIDGLQRSGKAL
jgi:microcystin degradation protein MlrC